MKVTLPFGEWRPDMATLDNEFASIAENVFPGANSYLPFPGFSGLTLQSLLSGGNDSHTKIMLHCDGTDASTTFTDDNSGGSAHTWTAAGNAQIDTAQSKFGGASGLFDGTGDWVSTGDHDDFTLGSGDFTVDCWVRPAVDGSSIGIGGQGNTTATAATTSIILLRTAGNKAQFAVSDGASFTTVTGTTDIVAGAWYHIAGVRSGNALTLFVNGVSEGTPQTFSGSVNNSTDNFRIGGVADATPWNGWIDEFRLSNVARWVANYTPPTVSYILNGTPCGLYVARLATGGFKIYAGTTTRLFSWSSSGWADISRTSGGNYAVPAGDLWTFEQSGTKLVACQLGDVPQSIDIDAGSNFAALGGSPPTAGHVKQIGDFLFLSRLSSNKRKIQWSAVNDITGWTVGTNLSDEQEFPDGGDVVGVAGGEVGYVVQDRTIRMLQFLPGDTSTIFSFSRVVRDRGSVSKYGFADKSTALPFLAENGFYIMNGPQIVPIGEEMVNEWFLANSDPARRNIVQSIVFPNHSRVAWAYHGSADADMYDKLIIFDPENNRWTTASISARVWAPIASTGLDLDTTGGDVGDALLDSAAPSLDSYGYVGGRPVIGAIDQNGILSFLSGKALEATIETAERHLVPGKRSFVSEAYPVIDSQTVMVAAGKRESLQDTRTWDAAVPLEVTGSASVLSSSRLHRFRVTIPAGETWTHAQGIVVEAQPDGMA